MTPLPKHVRIVEVGPRDGLQNESKTVETGHKAEFVRMLVAAGLKDIEVASFVHPKWVPQLADADELIKKLEPHPDVRYSALVPNLKGLERAIASGIRRIAVFTAASETFNRKNINMGIDESLEVFRPVVSRALQEGISVRGYISTCFVCPYEGPIAMKELPMSQRRFLIQEWTKSRSATPLARQLPAMSKRPAVTCFNTFLLRSSRCIFTNLRHGHCQCLPGAANGIYHIRQLGRRARRMSVCSRSFRQRCNRRPAVPSRSSRHRDRGRIETRPPRILFHRAGTGARSSFAGVESLLMARLCESRLRVRYAETDQMGMVYYANYLIWMEVGRSDLCRQCGFSYRELEREEQAFLAVAEATCRYRPPLDMTRKSSWKRN